MNERTPMSTSYTSIEWFGPELELDSSRWFEELPRFTCGQIVRLHDYEFAGELGQVVAIDEESLEVLVKLYAHIDYRALGPGMTSQRLINNTRSVKYQAPTAAFDATFFEKLGVALPFADLPIGPITVRTHFWDGDYFIGKFMYRWFHADSLAGLHEDDGITALEKWRFTSGVAPFEHDLLGFVETMKSTPESSGLKRQVNFQHRFADYAGFLA
jgi:hypothetical protein